ncbi:hypothetical protein [Microvirga sp. VF16]|uniref:hypothetical protein n=1 Tax=Microvirga sp. VF16 TaxID=2807101 RepID=UPI00193D3238|nr:hypothetical protein [Microvirga sp. VF16]QRM29251.1 hypothetical protein JO965_24300 [Microvirga sp. VF16]
MLRFVMRSWRSAEISLLLSTAQRIETAPRDSVVRATKRTGRTTLRMKGSAWRSKETKDFNTSAPERIPAPMRLKKASDEIALKDFLRIWNRRIFTDLAGGRHAFELRNVRLATQPATGIMLRTANSIGRTVKSTHRSFRPDASHFRVNELFHLQSLPKREECRPGTTRIGQSSH